MPESFPLFPKSLPWLGFLLSITFSLLAQAASPDDATPTNTATAFFEFPAGYQPENVTPRRNGQLLVSMISVPELYQINPFANQNGKILHRFDGYTSLFAIAELRPDVFYAAASNFTGDPEVDGRGSVSLFEIDLRRYGDGKSQKDEVKVRKVLDATSAQTIDGLVVINANKGLLIGGAPQDGVLYLFDISRKTAQRILKDPLLEGGPIAIAPPSLHVGLNGLKLRGSDLYFTNTNKTILGKVPVDLRTGKTNGPAQLVHEYGTYLDDFNFDRSGNVFLTANLEGVLLQPREGRGQPKLLAALPGSNSCAFGRTKRDVCVLYVTYDGASSGGVARIRMDDERFCGRVFK